MHIILRIFFSAYVCLYTYIKREKEISIDLEGEGYL